MEIALRARKDVELMASKPAWTFGGALLVLRKWDGAFASRAHSLVAALEKWSDKNIRDTLLKQLHSLSEHYRDRQAGSTYKE